MSTNDSQHSHTSEAMPSNSFGLRLKTARESMGLDRKDVANQLRLSEEVITMMEKETYPDTLPVTFIRGYIRSYGKLLQMPETEILKGVEPIKQKPVLVSNSAATTNQFKNLSLARNNYFIHLFTYLVVFTMITLALMWWFNKNPAPTVAIKKEVRIIANNQPTQNLGNTIAHEANDLISKPAPPKETKDSTKLAKNTVAEPKMKANPNIKIHDVFDESEFVDAE